MSQVATRRLIDAAATLDPAGRALLNLWVNRGLDDAAVARMTGMSMEAVSGRRAQIVEHLSALLGLPPEDVRGALTEIAAFSEAAPAVAAEAPAANGTAPLVTPAGDVEETEVTATTAPDPDAGSASRRPRGLWIAAALVVIAAAVILVVSVASSGSGPPRGPAAAARQTAPPPTPSTPTPSPAATRPPGVPLVALPGGPAQATGSVLVSRKRSHPKLDLSVRDLPAVSNGHYQVWLYDSMVTSEPLARLRTGVTHLSLRLPANARRYQWIDISVQPTGHVFHSGESVLRSANPLFASAAAHHR